MTPEQINDARVKFFEGTPGEQRRAVLAGIEALRGNAAWFALIEPWVARKAALAAEKHEDETTPAGERAEWLHAMKLLRELSRLCEKEKQRGNA